MTSFSRRVVLVVGSIMIALGAFAPGASAHPISTTAILLDIGRDDVRGTIQLPLDELGVAFHQELTAGSVVVPDTLAEIRAYVSDHLSVTSADQRSWTSKLSGGRVQTVDGVNTLALNTVIAPTTGTVGPFDLHYDAIIDRVASHRVFVSARQGPTDNYTLLVMLSWQRTSVPVTANANAASSGFVSAIRLGISHIRSGSDHLLFVTMLLLPAPLVAIGSRWRRNPSQRHAVMRVVHVISAFTIGHSVTLALGALGLVSLPTRLVESGIALSVMLSALHAIRPVARRGEVVIAGGFGLLHGLSFATVLQHLDLTRTGLITNLAGFNIGIELTQLCVVVLVMPSLILLSRTTLYPAFRIGFGSIGSILAGAWLIERIGLISSNPLEGIASLVVDHPLLLSISLGLVAIVAATSRYFRPTPIAINAG